MPNLGTGTSLLAGLKNNNPYSNQLGGGTSALTSPSIPSTTGSNPSTSNLSSLLLGPLANIGVSTDQQYGPFKPASVGIAGGLNIDNNGQVQNAPISTSIGQSNINPISVSNTTALTGNDSPPDTSGSLNSGGNTSNYNINANYGGGAFAPNNQNQQGQGSLLGGFGQDPATQAYIQQQQQVLSRLGALQGQLAQANVPSSAEFGLQQNINEVQNSLNNLNPQQYLRDNPALANNGISEGQLERNVSQADIPLTQNLANLVLAKSALGQNRQYQAQNLGAQATGLEAQATIGQQLRQSTLFGGLPSDVASSLLQKQLFPPYQVATDISGQPIVVTQQPGGGFSAQGIGGLTGSGGIGTQSFGNQSQGQGVVGGYNLSTYATDHQYAQKVGNIYNQIPQFNSAGQIDQYIQQTAPNSPITGAMVMASSTKYGVDPRMLVAQAQEESQFGTKGAATSTFNPGNVGNTGSATQNMGSWQAGLDAQAQELSNRSVQGQSQSPLASQPNTINIAGLPVQMNYMTDGTPYIAQSKVDSRILPYVQSAAPSMGIQVLNDLQYGKVQNIDVTQQNLNNLSNIIPNLLGSGLLGRLQGETTNRLGAATESDPKWTQFNSYRTIALNSIQALASGEGSGFRLTQGEIDTATNNLPTITDNLESAQQKIATLNGFLKTWTNEILPNNNSRGNTQIPGQGAQGGNDPLGIL